MSHKILIVDDDQSLREMYLQVLARPDFDLRTVSDGTEAFYKIKAFMPDLILLDLIIPGINGLDLLKKIKADNETEHIKVFVITNTPDYKEELLENGALNVYLKTELTPGQLIQHITSALSQNQAY